MSFPNLWSSRRFRASMAGKNYEQGDWIRVTISQYPQVRGSPPKTPFRGSTPGTLFRALACSQLPSSLRVKSKLKSTTFNLNTMKILWNWIHILNTGEACGESILIGPDLAMLKHANSIFYQIQEDSVYPVRDGSGF